MSETRVSGYALREDAYSLLSKAPPEGCDEDEEIAWMQSLCDWADYAEDKLAAYRAVREACASREAAFKREAAAWSARAKSQATVAGRISDMALGLLQTHRQITGESFATLPSGAKVRIGKSTRVAISCKAEDLPEAYRKTTTTTSAVKAAIAKALKAKIAIDGCALETTEHVKWS